MNKYPPFTIIAFPELPKCFEKSSLGHLFFVTDIKHGGDSHLGLFFKIHNEQCGRLWIFVAAIPDPKRYIMFDSYCMPIFSTHLSLSEKMFWRKASREAEYWDEHLRECEANGRENNIEELISLFVCDYATTDDDVKAEILGLIFTDRILPNGMQLTKLREHCLEQKVELEQVTILPVETYEQIKEVKRLACYERISRFAVPGLWEKIIQDCSNSLIICCARFKNSGPQSMSQFSSKIPPTLKNAIWADSQVYLGYLAYTYAVNSSDRGHEDRTIDIISVAVDPEFRRLGLGEFMLKQLLMSIDDGVAVNAIVPEECIEMLSLIHKAGFGRGTLLRSNTEEPDSYYFEHSEPSRLASNLYG